MISGNAEFLSERAVERALSAVRLASPDVEVTHLGAADLTPGLFLELTSPSLFGGDRALVVVGLQDCSDEIAAVLEAYAVDPAPDGAVVLVHDGVQKGRRLLDRLRAVPGVEHVVCEAPKPWDLPKFVIGEVRARGGSITQDAAAFMVTAIGGDLRALAGAVHQLVSDFAPTRLTVEIVRRYYDGRAEVRSFDIADAAIAGQREKALEQLRWATGNGVPSLLLISAFASGFRSLARLASAPRGLRDAELAREIGAPPFRLRALRAQLRGWDEPGLTSAIRAVEPSDARSRHGGR